MAVQDNYYDNNAKAYFKDTISVDMSNVYCCFLKFIPLGGAILDAGSGSGRDTLTFSELGYDVSAIDASKRLAELSSSHTRIQTKVIKFEKFVGQSIYDGIWACASLIHVKRDDLPNVFHNLSEALKLSGIFFFSFKYGDTDRISSDGRMFTDMNEEQVNVLIQRTPGLNLIHMWKTEGEGNFKGRDVWINGLAKRAITNG